MKTIMLTGATGFLGSHLLKSLLADSTAYQIVLLKRSFSNTSRIATCIGSPNVCCYDVDQTQIAEVFKQQTIDAIIHCATEYGRQHAPILQTLETNLMFPIQLLECAIEHQTKIFINTDSYFNKPHLHYPYLLHYSLSKKSLLLWLAYFADRLAIANLSLEHIYGEHDNPDKFVSHIVKNVAVAPLPSITLSPGDQKRDFIYVKDAASAYLSVLKHLFANGTPGLKTYEVGTGNAVPLKDFVETIKRQSASPTRLEFGALPYREDEIMFSQADTSALLELGWKPRFNIDSGIREMLNHL